MSQLQLIGSLSQCSEVFTWQCWAICSVLPVWNQVGNNVTLFAENRQGCGCGPFTISLQVATSGLEAVSSISPNNNDSMIYSSVVATTNSNPSQVEITYASRDKASCVVQYTVCSGTSTRVLGVQGHDCSQAMATVDFQWWIIFIIVLAVLMVFSFGTAWAYPTSPRILVAAPNQQPQTSSPPPSERTGSSLTVYGVPVEADVPLATEIPNPGKSAVKTASEIV